jgi:phosphohistidine phosphatase
MELYLIRHGIAIDRTEWLDDRTRPLIPKGIKKFRKVSANLKEIGIKFDLIQSSPLTRARETAAILKEYQFKTPVTINEELSPEGNINNWLDQLREYRQQHPYIRRLAIVGHEPDLSQWAEYLIFGEVKHRFTLKKGGIIAVNIPDHDRIVGSCELLLLLSPKIMMY